MKSSTPDISAFARLDFDRARRTGFGETVYGPGKTPAQLAEIFAAFKRKGRPVLATRVSAEQAAALSDSLPDATYDPTSRTLASSWRTRRAKTRLRGVVAVLTGGTADMPAAEEAATRGLSVVLFERDLVGGTCLNRGCIPTKALLHDAAPDASFKAIHTRKQAVVLQLLRRGE